MISSTARWAAAVVAIVAWAGELAFIIANANVFKSVPRAIWWTVSFLTDWSGILVALVCTAVALGWRQFSSPAWRGVATGAILLVGTMFALLGGWPKVIPHTFSNLANFSSVLAHVVTPVAMVIVWLIFLPHGGLRRGDAARFMLFPLIYLVEMFARGLLGGGYPYPEVDVPAVGWTAALTFAGGVTLLFLVIGLIVVAIDGLLARRSARSAVDARS